MASTDCELVILILFLNIVIYIYGHYQQSAHPIIIQMFCDIILWQLYLLEEIKRKGRYSPRRSAGSVPTMQTKKTYYCSALSLQRIDRLECELFYLFIFLNLFRWRSIYKLLNNINRNFFQKIFIYNLNSFFFGKMYCKILHGENKKLS